MYPGAELGDIGHGGRSLGIVVAYTLGSRDSVQAPLSSLG